MNLITDRLPPKLDKTAWVGIDLEIFDINQLQMHRPTSGKFALLTVAHGDDVYVIDDEKKVAPALSQVNDAWWIIQNAKFDVAHLRRWATVPPRTKLWDTMLIDRLLWGGYYDAFSLDDLVRRYLFFHLGKELQKSWTGSEISREQLEYAAMDAWVLPQIAEAQKGHVKSKEFRIWNEIDRPALFAFLDFPGFAINVQAWEDLAIRNKARQEAIDLTLPVNPRSHKQVKDYFWNQGHKIKNTQHETLEELFDELEDGEAKTVLSNILDSRMYSTRASRYGLNFISNYIEYDNGVPVIVANYWTTGADTGRTASDDPNMQNIPVRDTKEFRECFIARPGHRLIVVDYDQQEICITAYISQDKVLVDICNSGEDVYVLMAKEVFRKNITRDDPLRKTMKAIVLGTNYGMTAHGLARRIHTSVDEAEEVLGRVWKKFRRLKAWMDEQQSKKKYVETVAGRKYWLNPYNTKSDRNALNSPVQGSAGDCMKQALGYVHQNWFNITPTNFGVVGYIHDELVLDVPEEEASHIAQSVEAIMVRTAQDMFPGMKFRAKAVIGSTWACKE